MLLPVDDHSGDLLVHEYQNGDQQRGECGSQVHPPGVPSEREDEPGPRVIRGLDDKKTMLNKLAERTQSGYLISAWTQSSSHRGGRRKKQLK